MAHMAQLELSISNFRTFAGSQSLNIVVVDIGAGAGAVMSTVVIGAVTAGAVVNDPDGPVVAVVAVPLDMQIAWNKWCTQGKNNVKDWDTQLSSTENN
jgi:hypothetical protein